MAPAITVIVQATNPAVVEVDEDCLLLALTGFPGGLITVQTDPSWFSLLGVIEPILDSVIALSNYGNHIPNIFRQLRKGDLLFVSADATPGYAQLYFG